MNDEPKLFSNKRRQIWLEMSGKYHLVKDKNGRFMPGGLSTGTPKGERTYFEDFTLLGTAIESMRKNRLAIKQGRRKQRRERETRDLLYKYGATEKDKIVNALIDGQHIMVYSSGKYLLAVVKRSAKGNLCVRKYDRKKKQWARRLVPLDRAHYRGKLTKSAVTAYIQSSRWPRGLINRFEN